VRFAARSWPVSVRQAAVAGASFERLVEEPHQREAGPERGKQRRIELGARGELRWELPAGEEIAVLQVLGGGRGVGVGVVGKPSTEMSS